MSITYSVGERDTRPWGTWEVVATGDGHVVKRIMVVPGARLSLQRHRHRAEHWVVVEGSPRVWVGGARRRLRARQSVTVPRGAWHRIENPGKVPTVIIEVQHGSYLGEDDIIRKHDDYGRTGAGGAGRSAPLPISGGAGSARPGTL
jgi:mannose-1-phosphate guanylyltransferase/mannose-6-phosphate isomerase